MFILFSNLLINFANILNFTFNDYPFITKITIISRLIFGAFTTISDRDIFMILLISTLFGVNLSLVLEKFKFIKKQNNLKITFGAGIISIASAGCASCGLSLVSLVGLGGALAILPFGGFELYILAAGILFASIIYNLNSIYKACEV